MKKLFVSVPMKGRTVENIKASIEKMHKIAEILEGEQLELIDSYVEGKPPVNSKESVWYLGESIKKLSEADVFIGIGQTYEWHGCDTEAKIAGEYHIKSYYVPFYQLLSKEEIEAAEERNKNTAVTLL